MSKDNKLRVMLISPFTNSEVREYLHFKEYTYPIKWFLKKIGLVNKANPLKDTAPWVGRLLSKLEGRTDVEVYSVGPHVRLKNAIEHFKLRGIYYYFYSSDFSSAMRLTKSYKLWRRCEKCTSYVKKIADEIKPDIVVLSGAENPVTSVSILGLDKYPCLCICQTIYNNPDRAKYSTVDVIRGKLEEEILNKLNYFCIGGRMHYELLRRYNCSATVFPTKWPKERLPQIINVEKHYDFVNWAFAMDGRKGDEDAIKALAIVKEKYPSVTLNLTGGLTDERREYLEGIIKKLALTCNVSFTPFFERREDLYAHINEARFALLPVKLDIISGTINEAMFYNLPLVTYKTSGTPKLNEGKERVLIAEMDDVNGLAKCMIELLGDEKKAKMLAHNSHEYRMNIIENDTAADDLVVILHSVIDKERNCMEIKENLKFDINKYPKY